MVEAKLSGEYSDEINLLEIAAEQKSHVILLGSLQAPDLADIRNANRAFKRLYDLYYRFRTKLGEKPYYSFPLGDTHYGILKRKFITREGYMKSNKEPLPTLNFMANEILKRNPKGEITESYNLDSLTISRKGVLEIASSGHIFIDGNWANRNYSYTELYIPQFSEPWVDWIFGMRKQNQYISPPDMSLPSPSHFYT